MPCALAIGGLDPGGGAGLVADLRAFAAAGVFGCAAATLTTVQSIAGLRSVRALPAREVSAQVLEVIAHQDVRAMKVGALGSIENVRAVAKILGRFDHIPAVVDTPMRPTRGRGDLLAKSAMAVLKDALMPAAALVTVNADEAGALIGRRVTNLGEGRGAAEALLAAGARAVLVKGGHFRGADSVDVLAVGPHVLELRARRVGGGPVHGTGCTLASLIAGRLAATRSPLDEPSLVRAVRWAKRTHHRALLRATRVGGASRVLVFAR